MAITGRDSYTAALAGGQDLFITKTVSRVAIAASWFSIFDLAGDPGAGVLAGTDVVAGVVPTDLTAGYPVIAAFGGPVGYLQSVAFANSVAARLRIDDVVWKGGAYAFNAAQTLAGQPSYAARIPGANYAGTQIWFECVTAFTGLLTLTVTYTNQAGVTGRTTGSFAPGVAPTVGRMFQLPLQTGDTGVQKIESVTSTVATAGTFNMLVRRKLWSNRVRSVNDGGIDGPERVGLPIMFADSALSLMCAPDSTATGIPEVQMRVVNG